MKFTLSENNNLQVVREATDPLKYYGGTWGDGESRVLYHVQQQLNALGFDLVKKRMHKDGHLVADTQQYLRVRNDKSTAPHIYLHNDHYAVTGLNDDWNTATDYLSASGTWHEKKCNHLLLAVTFDVFEKQPDCRERFERLLLRAAGQAEVTRTANMLRQGKDQYNCSR